jgi:hypothetical protein
MAKLEQLAKELESLNRPDLEELIENVRNDNFRTAILIRDLTVYKLKFFANKLASGHYDQVISENKDNDANKIPETTKTN